jgi:hypothetical protein
MILDLFGMDALFSKTIRTGEFVMLCAYQWALSKEHLAV